MYFLLRAQEYKGYIFKIMGGQDKQGFGMKQGVLVPGRVQLLMAPGDSCFRGFGRRKGERRRKSVRGCIVSPDLSVLNLVIVKKGAPPGAGPLSLAFLCLLIEALLLRDMCLHACAAKRWPLCLLWKSVQ